MVEETDFKRITSSVAASPPNSPRDGSEAVGGAFSDRAAADARAARLHALCVAYAPLADGFLVTDGAGERILFVNDAFAHMSGYPIGELVGASPRVLQGAEGRSPSGDLIRAVVARGASVKGEVQNRRPDQTLYHAEMTIAPIRAPQSAPTASPEFLVATVRDVTERRETEDEHRRREETFAALAESSPDVIAVFDRELRYRYISPAGPRATGVPLERSLGKTNRELGVGEAVAREWDDWLNQVFETGEGRVVEFTYGGGRPYSIEFGAAPPCEVMHFQTKLAPLRDASGRVWAVMAVSRDITPLMEGAQALRRSEARYRAIVQDQTDFIWRMLPDGTITFVNEAHCRHWGVSESEHLGKRIWDLAPSEIAAQIRERLAKLSQENPVNTSDAQMRTPRGEARWHQWTDRALFDDAGRLAEYQSVGHDVTERRQAEIALRAANDALEAASSRLRGVIEGTADPIAAVDRDYKFIAFNSAWATAFEKIFGNPARVGGDMLEAVAHLPEVHARARDGWGRAFRGEVHRGERLYSTDPDQRHYELTYSPIRGGTVGGTGEQGEGEADITGAVVIARDITEERQSENALRESEERWQLAVRGANDGIWDWNIQTGNVWFSPRWKEMLGYGENELNNGFEDWRSRLHPDDLPVAMQAIRDHAEGRTPYYNLEHRLRCKDGTYKWIMARAQATRDETGAVVRMIGSHTDITERKAKDEAIRAREEQYRLLADSIDDVVALLDLQGRFLYVSPSVEKLTGWNAGSLYGRQGLDLVGAGDRKRLAPFRLKRLVRGETVTTELRILRRDGSTVWVENKARLLRDDTGQAFRVLVAARDITERKRAEEDLLQSEARYRGIVEDQTEFICRYLPSGELTFVNEAYCRYLERDRDDLLGTSFFAPLASGADEQNLLQERLASLTLAHPTLTTETHVFHKDRPGVSRWLQWTDRALFDDANRVVEYQSVGRDITERKRAEEEIHWQAYHDPLTKLPNRALFRDRVSQAIARADRRHDSLAVLFLDLDGFKTVNDTLGHETGDALLKVVGARLLSALRTEDTIARMGGDEFTVLLPALAAPDEPATVAQRLLKACADPISIGGQEFFLSASIGISVFPQDGLDADALLQNADVAMYGAKDSGRNNYQMHTEAMNEAARERLFLEGRLRRAIERGELSLLYQPQVDFKTGKIVGAEALLRWNQAELGQVPQNKFIPLAEETGLIREIGEWALREACREAARWQASGHPLRVSVNFSARQLSQRGLEQTVQDALAEAGLDAARLDIEITESALLKSGDAAAESLERLRGLGVRLSVDDFGTGYSSLAFLRRFPLDVLKIDPSFVQELSTDPAGHAVVRAVIDLAHALSLEVIAEGVEQEAQRDALVALGCDGMQGYLFSRPVSADALTALLAGDSDHIGPHPRPLSPC